jgi:hypothetical protein
VLEGAHPVPRHPRGRGVRACRLQRQSGGQSLVAAGLAGVRWPLRGGQSLRSHQLRTEQHRTWRRPLGAGRASRPTAPSIVALEDANADPDHSDGFGARALRLQRQSGDQSLRTGEPLRERSQLQSLQSLQLRAEQRRDRPLRVGRATNAGCGRNGYGQMGLKPLTT